MKCACVCSGLPGLTLILIEVEAQVHMRICCSMRGSEVWENRRSVLMVRELIGDFLLDSRGDPGVDEVESVGVSTGWKRAMS